MDVDAALRRMSEPGPPRLEVLSPQIAVGPGEVAIIPGSFDPPTVAHVALATRLGEESDLVLWVYALRTLPKEAGPGGAPGRPFLMPVRRVEALLAMESGGGPAGVALSSHGLYVEQAEAAARAFPGARITLGVGSDKLRQIFDPRWYEDREAALERLFRVAEVAYAVREGDDDATLASLVAESRWADRLRRVEVASEVRGISSRAVREAIRGGADVAGMVPPAAMPFVAASR